MMWNSVNIVVEQCGTVEQWCGSETVLNSVVEQWNNVVEHCGSVLEQCSSVELCGGTVQ